MLTIYGKTNRFCDGISRRSFMKIGGFAFGSMASLTLPDILRAEAASGNRPSHKSIINIFLAGGPPHQDMWDVKSEAPANIRGEFKPIKTNVPGIEICEVFPRIAGMMDKFAVLRAIVKCAGDHDAYQCMTGWPRRALRSSGGYPAVGSVLAKMLGHIDRAIPPAVGLAAPTVERRWSDSGSPGYLGPAYAPFKPFMVGDQGRPGSQALVGKYENSPGLEAIKLKGITLERLRDRQQLLKSVDGFRRDLDQHANVQALDAANAAAFDVLSSNKLINALDLSKEDPKTLERYGDGKPYKYKGDGAPTANEQLLMARRLIEAGCRSVTLSYGRWDSHGANFDLVRHHGSRLDQCVSALVEDLDDRGMLEDVTVVVWGEFGRTPKINKNAGRDHWPAVNCALLAGGGMQMGQVIGSTDRNGAYADERPVHIHEVFSTLYHNLGIDVKTAQLVDRSGRPQYLLDVRQTIPELVG